MIGIVAVGCIGLGYFLFTQYYKQHVSVENNTAMPTGSHKMPDGTVMENAVTEGAMIHETDLKKPTEVKTGNQASIILDPHARVFEVKGINYGFDTKKITVKKGETVTINFESTDGFHDWVVDEFKAATKRVQPGVSTSVTFVADKVGEFEYYCSVGSHRAHGMVGTLVVEE